MDPFIELTNQLALFNQQLRMRQLANEHQRRVKTQVSSQVWQPYALMNYAQYKGTPYLSNHNFGWNHHPNTSWNTSYNTLQSPLVPRSSLEETMTEFSRPMAEMDYSQVGLPRFLDQNEKSHMSIDCQMKDPFAQVQPPQLPQEETLGIAEMANTHNLYMANAHTKFMDERSQAPQGENLSIAEMASVYTQFMDDARKMANKLLLQEQ